MLNRLIIAAAVTVFSLPATVDAQTPDAPRNVVKEALQHMRKTLGPNMVLNSRMRFVPDSVPHDTKGTPSQAIRVANPDDKRVCSNGFVAYRGPEKYVYYQDPVIRADTATIRVYWTYTSEGKSKSAVTQAMTLHLAKSDGKWRVNREGTREFLHMSSHYCKIAK